MGDDKISLSYSTHTRSIKFCSCNSSISARNHVHARVEYISRTTNRWWTTTWLCFWNCTTRGGTCVRISPIHARILSHGTSSYSISIHERPERPYLPRETRAARVSVLYENRGLQVWNHLQIPSPKRQSYSLTNLRFKPYWSPFATGGSSLHLLHPLWYMQIWANLQI